MPKLKDQIEARVKEANAKGISGKASTIALALGTTREEDTFTFKNESFEIKTGHGVIHGSDGNTGWSSTLVLFKDTPVFEEHGCRISTFIPGEWEEPFNALYDAASKRRAEMNIEERARLDRERLEDEARERVKWGL